ncbi:MAG TPA: carboxypeptidase-like regulatory domain-containing protein [Terriglobia bacterium]|nr:carboxypeptidase-like regulatory domain-containing protein [Terriglobia bacterium]
MKASTWVKLLMGVALVAAIAAPSPAQSLFATLTGVVSDPSGAVVAGATVKLINEASSSTRVTVTDSAGYYTFAAVSVGNFTYKLTVEKQGFQMYEATGLSILGGQKRNVNVTMQLGSTTQTVQVSGVASSIVPVDSGEKSETLTTKELQNYIQIGSDAAEYLKVMPGFAIQNGTSNKQNYDGEVIGINANGDAGSQSPLNNAYSYNGLPGNSLDIMSDGAHVSDPGCDCDTPVNPNTNFISEMKVDTSNFSAETQKGPIVVTSVTQAGGSQFHGTGFFSARNFALNANDALNNAEGAPKPQNKYYYPGFSIGGPVIIPGTSFNKSRQKLFFFTGYEYFYQTLDTGLLRATVPTPAIMSGDFSSQSLAALGDANLGYISASGSPVGVACAGTGGTTGVAYAPCLNATTLSKYPNGNLSSLINPNMAALMKLYPAANANPNNTGGYNFVQSEVFNQNNEQWDTRVDYNISDYTKLFVRYNLQRETQQFPVGLWWRNGSQVPYPTPVLGKNSSDSISASLTHIFSPTLTNEFVFGYTYVGFPNVFENPSKVNRTNVGYNIQGLFKNGVNQIPSFGSFGGETALVFNPGGFEAGGPSAGLYADKWMPSISDTVAKVINTHTIKAGFYWEWIRNSQPANNNTNGELQFVSSGNIYTTGDSYADELLGIASSYNESSFNRINDIAYNTYEGFVQDDWKVTKRLTLDYGLRFSHFQPWGDRLGDGFSIFNTSQYTGQACTAAPTFCGFEWHKKDSNVPVAGFPTRALFYQPRLGAAYDVFGTGKTVLRGGWGRYYYHAGQFTSGLDASAGVETLNLGSTIPLPGNTTQPLLVNPSALYPGAAGINNINFTAVASSPAAVDSKDDMEPYTDQYNITVSQQLPWSSLMEISYIGNRSRDIPTTGNGGTAGFNTDNINLVPVGAMLSSKNGGVDPAKLVADNFRPLLGYSDLYLATSNAYANYNALQVSWLRTKGRYTIDLNYTYGRAMGIIGSNGNIGNQFNLASNYGVLSSNRTHLFNAAYSVVLPSPGRGKLEDGILNGWQLSGITQLESGPNLTGYQNQNFGMNLNSAKIPGTTFNISNVSLLGTPDIQLNPVLTCNPRANLAPHQYINASCFAMPTQIGQNGPTILPPVYGPAYFDSDLGLFKTFKITESKSLQFRIDGYNFMNHPLWSFNGGNLGLSFDPTSGKVNNPTFGTVTTKQGHRIIEMTVKFYF